MSHLDLDSFDMCTFYFAAGRVCVGFNPQTKQLLVGTSILQYRVLSFDADESNWVQRFSRLLNRMNLQSDDRIQTADALVKELKLVKTETHSWGEVYGHPTKPQMTTMEITVSYLSNPVVITFDESCGFTERYSHKSVITRYARVAIKKLINKALFNKQDQETTQDIKTTLGNFTATLISTDGKHFVTVRKSAVENIVSGEINQSVGIYYLDSTRAVCRAMIYKGDDEVPYTFVWEVTLMNDEERRTVAKYISALLKVSEQQLRNIITVRRFTNDGRIGLKVTETIERLHGFHIQLDYEN